MITDLDFVLKVLTETAQEAGLVECDPLMDPNDESTCPYEGRTWGEHMPDQIIECLHLK